ncbi:MAG: translation initiation factor [Bacteroidales bacterium]
MKSNKKRAKGGVVYSTNPNYQYEEQDSIGQEPIPRERERLLITLDRRNRGGKQVTLIQGFQGSDNSIEELGKILKGRCGSGGSVKNREILIQGDFRERVLESLQSMGYNAKRGN